MPLPSMAIVLEDNHCIIFNDQSAHLVDQGTDEALLQVFNLLYLAPAALSISPCCLAQLQGLGIIVLIEIVISPLENNMFLTA